MLRLRFHNKFFRVKSGYLYIYVFLVRLWPACRRGSTKKYELYSRLLEMKGEGCIIRTVVVASHGLKYSKHTPAFVTLGRYQALQSLSSYRT